MPAGYTQSLLEVQEQASRWNTRRRRVERVEKYPCHHEHLVMHWCHNRDCVNPTHLQWGTQTANSKDRERNRVKGKGRGKGKGPKNIPTDVEGLGIVKKPW